MNLKYASLSVLMILLISCATSKSVPSSATTSGPRTLIIGEERISEADAGGFNSWYCKDLLTEAGIVLEVGFYNGSPFDFLGFILFDGGYEGENAVYQRKGLDRRWDWGKNAVYSFVLKTDGTGLYYDFSTVSEGESSRPRALYKCNHRHKAFI